MSENTDRARACIGQSESVCWSEDPSYAGLCIQQAIAYALIAIAEKDEAGTANDERVRAEEREALRREWWQALAEWGDGPLTMKATADWANRWVPRIAAAIRREADRLVASRRDLSTTADVSGQEG